MDPAALAAKRYKQFQAEERNKEIKRKLALASFSAAKGAILVLQTLGVFRRKHVEKINVD